MRILIVSDTHGKHKGIEQAILMERPVDMLLHLGDTDGYELYYQELADCPLEAIAGNNDFFSALPREKVVDLDGVRALMVHGHNHYIEYGLGDIISSAMNNACYLAICGHTHVPMIEKVKDITVVNPGSLTYPRQPGKKPSYMVMTTFEDKDPIFEIKYLD